MCAGPEIEPSESFSFRDPENVISIDTTTICREMHTLPTALSEGTLSVTGSCLLLDGRTSNGPLSG